MKAILSNLGVRVIIIGRPKELAGDDNNKDWAEMDEMAFLTIQLCVSDSTLQDILIKTTAAGAWNKLEETFMKKMVTNRL
jgi:gag-polypeptide of LTR copia-type